MVGICFVRNVSSVINLFLNRNSSSNPYIIESIEMDLSCYQVFIYQSRKYPKPTADNVTVILSMSRRGSDSTIAPTNAINTIAGSISSTGVVNMPKST